MTQEEIDLEESRTNRSERWLRLLGWQDGIREEAFEGAGRTHDRTEEE